tara:strand:- start:716 stop:1030 length:315 start_codon:yes stop_codon:yes gene_type:complete
MYSAIFLKTENELNKVLRRQRKTKNDLGILFVSLWDDQSEKLVKEIRRNLWGDKGKPLYIVDSFKMPHAFVIFNTTKLPHLIQLKRGAMESEDYLSKVYEELGL